MTMGKKRKKFGETKKEWKARIKRQRKHGNGYGKTVFVEHDFEEYRGNVEKSLDDLRKSGMSIWTNVMARPSTRSASATPALVEVPLIFELAELPYAAGAERFQSDVLYDPTTTGLTVGEVDELTIVRG